ncbi:MAG TPA: MmcQ/YjbR family DNA-binding protein [Puia sp.]|nr:MmcQ/YjbR family DNA-binding protein [Puia sp.]
MVSIETFRQIALSFPETEEHPHFHLASFRKNKKIFATLWEKDNKAMLKLPLADQYVYCALDKDTFYPVPGVWGKQGSTFVDLNKVKKPILKEALKIAYENSGKKQITN